MRYRYRAATEFAWDAISTQSQALQSMWQHTHALQLEHQKKNVNALQIHWSRPRNNLKKKKQSINYEWKLNCQNTASFLYCDRVNFNVKLWVRGNVVELISVSRIPYDMIENFGTICLDSWVQSTRQIYCVEIIARVRQVTNIIEQKRLSPIE